MISGRFFNKKYYLSFFIISSLCWLSSCGFHLRGDFELPENLLPLYLVENTTDKVLQREIRVLVSQVDRSNLTSSKKEAGAILTITRSSNKRRVVAVDNRGRARQYELSYRVSYHLRWTTDGDDGKKDIHESTKELHLKRELLFDPDSVLAISHEANELQNDMRKDSARLILQQIKSIGYRQKNGQEKDDAGGTNKE
jgi:LPS-assembly lipoprotein